jgi:3-methyladenine DNA glycosylase/8-oxoguanine DNA glycosylase
MRTALRLQFPSGFHFEHTIYSHGWCALFPFRVDREANRMSCPLDDGNGCAGTLHFTLPSQRSPRVEVESRGIPSAARRAFFEQAARVILNLDLDLRPFYRRIAEDEAYAWIAKLRGGRMLRAPTFFEDVLKMILTTNCSWSLTELMNERLIENFGRAASNGARCFPRPEAIADSSEAFLRQEVRLGYRAPFVLELARRVASGDLDIESFRGADGSAADLHRALRGIKGVGEYAASNLLKLLGRHDYLGLDSWCRAKFAELHNGGMTVPDAAIEAHYARFEEWKGLVMWMDVTRHWYSLKFPF